MMKRAIENIEQFCRLETISFKQGFSTTHKIMTETLIGFREGIQKLESEQQVEHCTAQLKCLCMGVPTSKACKRSILQAHSPTLVHLQLRARPARKTEEGAILFSNLQVLEVDISWFHGIKSFTCPNLKLLVLFHISNFSNKMTVPENLPASIQMLRLLPQYINSEVGSTRKGLDALKKNCPDLEVLRLDQELYVYPEELIKMVKSRVAAAKKASLKAIKKLNIDYSKLDETSLVKLRDLVKEVEDVGTASAEVVVDC